MEASLWSFELQFFSILGLLCLLCLTLQRHCFFSFDMTRYYVLTQLSKILIRVIIISIL